MRTPRTARVILLIAGVALRAVAAAEPPRDVVVYGATSGGIVAAIQAEALGRSVVVVEPGRHLGGLTSGGLGATDIGNKRAIGGLSREFYRRVGRQYADPAAWVHERQQDYENRRKVPGEVEMWTFEPHVAERVYREWLAEAGVEVVTGERLDLNGGVAKEGVVIRSIRMESGRTFAGRMFIDATYEGDLMAEAGVSFCLLSRICGLIPVPAAGPTHETTQF